MLRGFLISHRRELVRKCQEKAAGGFSPADKSEVLEHGVPLFIQQLIDALATRPSIPANDGTPAERTVFPAEIHRSAALHGAELLQRGFTADEVVHSYGDICQAITEVAIELNCPIVPDDFRILNGCLDNAIAGAVTAFAQGHKDASDDREDERSERLSVLQQEHLRLVEIAMQAFTAIKSGGLGVAGPTGSLLMHALTELRSLSEQPDVEHDEGSLSHRKRAKAVEESG